MDLYRSMGGPNVRSTIYLVWHGMELGTRTSGPPKDRYRFIFFSNYFGSKAQLHFVLVIDQTLLFECLGRPHCLIRPHITRPLTALNSNLIPRFWKFWSFEKNLAVS